MEASNVESKVLLRVRGIDLNDRDTLDALALHLDDLGWEAVGGQVTAVLYTTSPDPVAAALDAAHAIEKALPGATVDSVDEQLVSLGDIADRLDMTSEGVRLWVTGKRRAGVAPFPEPRAHISQGRTLMKIWAWADVADWLRNEYRLDPEEGVRYLSRREVAELNAELAHRSPRTDRWRAVADHGCERVLARVNDALESNRVQLVAVEASSGTTRYAITR
jgi:hypothetical protein